MALSEGARGRLAILFETMLGEDELLARDIADFAARYVATIPPFAALGLRIMLWAIVWLPIVFVGRLGPASALDPATRERYMDRWVCSRLYFVREGFFLVKAVALFGWGAHPRVRARFGMPPVAVEVA
jgi:hypothetical protein